jgi:pimeloyl-ACP methyl ester carboxylesterase
MTRLAATNGVVASGIVHVGDLSVHEMHGGHGSPVLFIHGLGSSGYMEWRFNLQQTASEHLVFAPDLPGCGRSAKPRASYDIDYFTRFVESYMDKRELRSAAVVAVSMGGRVALELALRRPERVRKLVLVNSLGLGRPNVHLSYGLVTIPRVGEAMMRGANSALKWAPAKVIRRVASRYMGKQANAEIAWDDEYLGHLRELYGAEEYRDAYLATVRSLVNPKALFGAEYDLTGSLSKIQAPVQLIWGAEDPLFPVAHATRAHALIQNSRLAVIEGAGHTPQAERPEEFNRVLNDFLSA